MVYFGCTILALVFTVINIFYETHLLSLNNYTTMYQDVYLSSSIILSAVIYVIVNIRQASDITMKCYKIVERFMPSCYNSHPKTPTDCGPEFQFMKQFGVFFSMFFMS